MRLAISRSGFFNADVYCADSRAAKKILREEPVTLLALDYFLVGKSNGCELLDWAAEHGVLPRYVVLIERDRSKRGLLASLLRRIGFHSKDETNFINPAVS